MTKKSSSNLQPHYAGFWIRLAASAVDSILLAAAIFPLLIAFYGKTYFDSDKFIQGPADFLLTWIFPILAIMVFWFAKSATPGKILFRLLIVDAKTLQKPSTKQFIIRYLGYYVSALPFCLGFIWIGFDKRKQGWHDKLANTLVIHETKL